MKKLRTREIHEHSNYMCLHTYHKSEPQIARRNLQKKIGTVVQEVKGKEICQDFINDASVSSYEEINAME